MSTPAEIIALMKARKAQKPEAAPVPRLVMPEPKPEEAKAEEPKPEEPVKGRRGRRKAAE